MDLERQLRHRRESLVHVDATLRILDPEIQPGEIPNARLSKRVKLFGQGQLGRLILDAFRTSGGEPIPTAYIVDSVLAAGGHGDGARRAVSGRVRGNLAYLERRGKIEKLGDGRVARWRLQS